LPACPPADTPLAQLAPILDSISYTVVLLDRDARVLHLNTAGERLLAAHRADVLGRDATAALPALFGGDAFRRYRQFTGLDKPGQFEEYYRPLDLWTECHACPSAAGLLVCARDVTARKARDRVLTAQKIVLELVATGAPLPEILAAICRVVEGQSTDDLCSILRVSADGRHLETAAGGSLPDVYNQSINGAPIGPAVGSCGTAAHTRQRVVVADIATDPRWAAYKHLALPHGLCACWSQPILSRDGARVLGTVANYSRAAGEPSRQSVALLETAAHLAQIAFEQAHADETLRRHAIAFDNLHDGIILTDDRGRITDWNPAAARMFGYSREEAIGTAFARLHDRATDADLDADILDALHRDGRWRGELPFVRKDGTPGVAESIVVPVIAPPGDVVATVGVHRDVTDRKRAESHLLTEAAVTRVLAAADGTRDALPRLLQALCATCGWRAGFFWAVDPDRQVIRCRAAHAAAHDLADFARVTQPMSLARGVGLPGRAWDASAPVWVTDVRHDDNFPRRAAARAAGLRGALAFPVVVAGQVVAVLEFFTDAPRDPDRQLDAMLTILGGQIGHFLERDRLLASEQDARAAAESANRAKDHFIAVLSHELRTPLSPVSAGAQLLESDPTLTVEQRDVAGMIRRNADLEARLIDDLLDVTRISRGKLSLHVAPTDVHEQVRRVREVVAPEAAEKNVTLDVETLAQHHFARADAARLQQVLWNLAQNAVKFTPAGGRVTLRTENPDHNYVHLVVHDTGRGIDPALLPHIFTPFEQGGADVTDRFGGLGLGLAISKGLIDLHGGTLAAHSAGPGTGATFVCTLPTCAPPPDPSPDHRPAAAAPTDPAHPARRILLV
jgi:PAS domain S-box-containing protein